LFLISSLSVKDKKKLLTPTEPERRDGIEKDEEQKRKN
jgi:hypothetical protein